MMNHIEHINTPCLKNEPNLKRYSSKIIRIDFDDIWQKYSKDSRTESACFSFHVGLHFLSTFRLSNWTPKITPILTL